MTHATYPHSTAPVRRLPAIALAAGALLLAGLGVVAVTTTWSVPTPPSVTVNHVQPRAGVTQADVRIAIGGGALTVGPLSRADAALSRTRFDGPDMLQPSTSVSLHEGAAMLAYATRDVEDRWLSYPMLRNNHGRSVIELSPNVPLDLDVQVGATASTLDLADLQVARMDVQAGVGELRLVLPATTPRTDASVKAAVGEVDIRIPDGVAADIRIDGAIGDRMIDQARFQPLGDGRYRSAGYAAAAHRVELQVEVGIGRISIN
jgi:hypothetical protein